MAKKSAPKKKAAKKKTAKKTSSATAAPIAMPALTESNLVAATDASTKPVPANITCNFFSGIGQITATLFRQGVMINMQSVSSTGTINFSDVKSGDAISVNGVCAGNATIELDRTTTPPNPKTFERVILAVFLIN